MHPHGHPHGQPSGQPNKILLEYLYDVLVSHQQPPSLGPGTPSSLSLHYTPNQKFLQAAAAYTEACIVKAPGTDPVQATKLAQLAFQAQQKYGHHCIPHDPSNPDSGLGPTGAIETLTPSHAQLWHAAGAALLYCALQVGDDATAAMAQKWWRAEAALCHLTAWQNSWNLGSYEVIAPGARGGSYQSGGAGATTPAPAAQNSTRDLDYELLLNGTLPSAKSPKIQNQYYTATLILAKLTHDQIAVLNRPGQGEKLVGPNGQQGPWTSEDVPLLPSQLFVVRNGNQHAAWFESLDALQPQFQAGVNSQSAWYTFYNPPPGDLPNGGQSVWPAPQQPGGSIQKFGPQQV